MTNHKFKIKKRGGMSLIEVMLAVSLLALMSFMFVNAFVYTTQISVLSGERKQATYLAEEGINAVINLKDESFLNLVDGEYGLEVTGGEWQLTPEVETISSFTRTIIIETVGINQKRILSRVGWDFHQVELETYVTNWED